MGPTSGLKLCKVASWQTATQHYENPAPFRKRYLYCLRSLIAFELDVASAERARELVLDKLTGCGVENSDADTLAAAWVRTGDCLFEADGLEADFVIGNPPYVRLEKGQQWLAALSISDAAVDQAAMLAECGAEFRALAKQADHP